MMCDNYRPVPLLCTTYTILTSIVYVQLVPYAEEIMGEYQEGFRRVRSTIDQIFTIRQIFEKCWEQNVVVYELFIDF